MYDLTIAFGIDWACAPYPIIISTKFEQGQDKFKFDLTFIEIHLADRDPSFWVPTILYSLTSIRVTIFCHLIVLIDTCLVRWYDIEVSSVKRNMLYQVTFYLIVW